jgi:hypothetical protein
VSKTLKIGVTRDHKSLRAKSQREALEAAGYEIIVELGSKVNGHVKVLYDAARQLRKGCHVGFYRLWLLAEAKGKSPRRKAEIKTIVREFEKPPRQAIMHEVATNRLSSNKIERDDMIADALDDLKNAELVWRNTKTYRSWAAAGAKLPNGMTTRDAYNLWGSRKKQDNK